MIPNSEFGDYKSIFTSNQHITPPPQAFKGLNSEEIQFLHHPKNSTVDISESRNLGNKDTIYS